MPERILVLRPTLGQGGADRVTLTLLQELDRSRFRPTLVLMHRAGSLIDQVPADVPVMDLGGVRLWGAWWPLARLLRKHRPDVLFSTSSGANVVAALAAMVARFRGRVVLSERGRLVRQGRAKLKSWTMLGLKRWLYPRADCVTTVSAGVAQELRMRLGLGREKLSVVYNPIVTADFATRAAQEPNHPWLSSDARVPVIVGAGRLVAEKNFSLLIRSFAELRRVRPCRLLIFGEGPLRAELEQLVQELGVAGEAALPGFVPDPLPAMARATVFVLSSNNEGLPGVLIQAMACGAPAIATDCPSGPAEIIEHGRDGLLIPTEDQESMVSAIASLLDQAELREQLGGAAARSARRFGAQRVIANYARALAPEGAASCASESGAGEPSSVKPGTTARPSAQSTTRQELR